MKRILCFTLTVLGLVQFSQQNLPPNENMKDPEAGDIISRMVQSSTSAALIHNLENLSFNVNTSSINWKSWIETDKVEKFQSMEAETRLRAVISEAEQFEGSSEFFLAIAETKLTNASNEIIKSDKLSLNFVKANSAVFDTNLDKLAKADVQLQITESKVEEYSDGLNECMRNFADDLSPDLTEITTYLNSELDESEKLIGILKRANSILLNKPKVENSFDALEKCAKDKAEICEKYLGEFYKFFVNLVKE